jgi:hypothetical protein
VKAYQPRGIDFSEAPEVDIDALRVSVNLLAVAARTDTITYPVEPSEDGAHCNTGRRCAIDASGVKVRAVEAPFEKVTS